MGSSRLSLTAPVLVLVVLFTNVIAFNLEPRIPVVKIGTPLSHFGYSVAQHQTVSDTVSQRKRITPW